MLVIEDDPALTALLVERLVLDGLEVESAPDGERGLASARANPPDVILLDIGLPGELDGWDVLMQLKTSPGTAGHPRHRLHRRRARTGTATTLGAADFVAKPFTGDQLRDAVRRHLPAERGSVLVVDDDETLRRLIVETLTRDGRELREARDGLEALELIADRTPDVLVLDLAMPRLDGFGVLAKLIEQPETRRLPVIVLTARDLSASERVFLKERSAWLLEKREYSGDELRSLVHQALGRSIRRLCARPEAASVERPAAAPATGPRANRVPRTIRVWDDSGQPRHQRAREDGRSAIPLSVTPAFSRDAAGREERMDDIDHVCIRASDLERSRAFYEAALAPLGWRAQPAETEPAGAANVGFGRS